MIDTFVTSSDLAFMLAGAGNTLLITLFAVVGGTASGLGLGLLQASGPVWATLVVDAVLDVLRSVPLLIQFVLANALNSILGLDLPVFTIACLMLAAYTAAYCAAIVRGGVLAVPATTRRAARSLGLTWFQDLRCIVFPIALRVALPGWIGLVLGVMKDTALVLWIGIIELLRASQIVVTRTQEPLLVLSVAGLIYFLMSYPVSLIGRRLEARWRESE